MDCFGFSGMGWSPHDREDSIGCGADTAIISDRCNPPHIAARKNKADIIAALVEAGTDIESRNRRGQTPLHSSPFFDSCAAMRALLRLGANVHADTPTTGSTSLYLAEKESPTRRTYY